MYFIFLDPFTSKVIHTQPTVFWNSNTVIITEKCSQNNNDVIKWLLNRNDDRMPMSYHIFQPVVSDDIYTIYQHK